MGWVKPVIDIMMAGVSETTDYHLTRIFSAAKKSENYIRIQPVRMGKASLAFDDASKENIRELTRIGLETAENCSEVLDRIVNVLLEGPDHVIFK